MSGGFRPEEVVLSLKESFVLAQLLSAAPCFETRLLSKSKGVGWGSNHSPGSVSTRAINLARVARSTVSANQS